MLPDANLGSGSNVKFRLPADRPAVMGVLNVTPDSFSDGGSFSETGRAVEHGLQMYEDGADLVDVGGESSRPGADPVSIDEELARVIPVIKGLAESGVPLSIDTTKPEVASAAISAGAQVLNDITGLRSQKMLDVAAKAGVIVCIMHMQGEPKTMQAAPTYGDVVAEVLAWLEARAQAAISYGVEPSDIWIDPGIGFGKTVDHNLSLLRATAEFASSGYPLVVGASRKSFIGKIVGEDDPANRLPGSLAAALFAAQKGARVLRVHDVAETVQALTLQEAIMDAE